MTATYTEAQMVGAEQAAGFKGFALQMITALGLRESGGAPRPYELNDNPSTKDYSVSPWQVNYFGTLLGPRTAAYGSPGTLETDINAAARAAWDISGGGTNWTPWSTYKGLPQSTLDQAGQIVADVAAGAPAANQPIGGGSPVPANLPPAASPNAAAAAAGGSSSTGSGSSSSSSGSCPPIKVAGISTGIPSPACLLKDAQAVAFGGILLAGGVALVVFGLWKAAEPDLRPAMDAAGAGAKAAAL